MGYPPPSRQSLAREALKRVWFYQSSDLLGGDALGANERGRLAHDVIDARVENRALISLKMAFVITCGRCGPPRHTQDVLHPFTPSLLFPLC